MGTSWRLSLLILTAILADNYPPHRPPGYPPSNDDFDTAKCPRCGNLSDWKKGKRFYCEYCDKYFVPN